MPKEKFKKFLNEIALGAGQILDKYSKRSFRIKRKPFAGIVTDADMASEAYLIKKILRSYPNSSIITEETGNLKGSSGLTWIIDPVDGTSNFAHGFPWYCVSIGLQVEGVLRAGAIYHPALKELFYAEKNLGSFLNGKRIRVSKTRKFKDALLGTGFYYIQGRKIGKQLRIFGQFNEKVLAVRRPGSAALDLAYVACGRYDGFWEQGLKCWDMAAGAILVEEAGGKITDYKGNPTTIFHDKTVASNSVIHPEMIKITRRMYR